MHNAFYIPLCFYFIGISWCCLHGYSVFYIPLCFYFIQIRNLSINIPSIFYIPLCFYFIYIFIARSSSISVLHSTMLLLYRYYRLVKEQRQLYFTFHYASTLSHYRDPNRSHSHVLHSTMLLLYLSKVHIPFGWSNFTFHYASTLSPAERNIVNRLNLLHSTMLLLYRLCNNNKILN